MKAPRTNLNAWTLAAALAIPLFAVAADDSINLKPGLWESTVTIAVQGKMALPPQVLAQLSPEQRQRIEQKSLGGGAPKPHVKRSCVKPGHGESLFSAAEREGMQCTRHFSRGGGSSIVGSGDCTGRGMRTHIEYDLRQPDPEHVSGKVTVTNNNGSNTMTTKSDISGHWLGAACGDVR